MYGKISNNKVRFGFFVVLVIVTAVISFPLASGSSIASINDPNAAARVIAQKRAAQERQIITAATQVFVESLQNKEKVDFVLTPALLMQEAMSQDVVITYPTE
jgi:hypothetical protein